jgi:hypothetical protein
MASGHTHDVVAELVTLDTAINALSAGAEKTAVRASYERLIALLALANGYTLRRGHELPAA